VRLRIGLVSRLLKEHNPDVLCLQETKCPHDQIPVRAVPKELGYDPHRRINGQKGYHGVAMRLAPSASTRSHRALLLQASSDCRHIAITLGKEAERERRGSSVHNSLCSGGR
jgi:exodeoxyribonuclease-3